MPVMTIASLNILTFDSENISFKFVALHWLFYPLRPLLRKTSILTLIIVVAGCKNPGSKPPTAPAQVRAPGAEALFAPPVPRESISTPTRIVDIAFTVMNADFSGDRAGDARKIWNHVDELRLKPDQAQLLARNGVRLGTASPASWPAIQTILDAGEARISSEQLFPQRGSPLPVKAGSVEEGSSIFCYRADGRLVGKSFLGGEKVILIDYALHPELDGCTDLGISFEINRESGEMVWEHRDGQVRQVPEQERHRFEDLTSILTMHPGEFLVLGPRDEVKNEYLVGTQFLASRKGEGSVRLTFLAPLPYQTQSAARPPS